MTTPALIEVHEDRIQRLENDVIDVKVELGVLGSKVENGFAMMSEKLDKLAQLDDRVVAIELREKVRVEVEAERAVRRRFRWKVVGGVGSALVGLLVAILKIAFGG